MEELNSLNIYLIRAHLDWHQYHTIEPDLVCRCYVHKAAVLTVSKRHRSDLLLGKSAWL